jgi:signal transduction histidine kinase
LEAERAERARLRDQLSRELEARLAAKVEELGRETAERQKTEQAMHRSQRMEAVGRLTGGIAHDFNNLLQRKLPEADPLRKFADNAAKAVQKGAKLTGQLLSLSRTQSRCRQRLLRRSSS